MDGDNRGAGRRLRLLVGGVVLAAGGCLVWAVASLPVPVPAAYPVLVAGLVAVAGTGTVYVRVRSQHQITTSSAVVLAAVVVLPAPWAVVCTVVGMGVAKAVQRQPPLKAAFNTGKETLGAAVAAGAAHAAGLVPVSTYDGAVTISGWLVPLCVAAVAYTLVDEPLPVPVIALASGTPWRRVAVHAWDFRAASRLVDVVTAALAVGLVTVDVRLVVLVPAGMLIAYLAYRHRLGVRQERAAWRRLAAASDALATASVSEDLTQVLHTAVAHANALFPASLAEVQLDGRLVRAGQDGAEPGFDGRVEQAPSVAGGVVEAASPADGQAPPVLLRLRFPRDGRLADREPHLLHTLAAAVGTAVRNTLAHATVVDLAARHRHDADHDALTGLPNRRRLNSHVTDLLAQHGPEPGQEVVMVLLDLDHFKEVNDTLGHHAGDEVLTEAADRLVSAAQAALPDALVARLGGDEFAVVFTATNPTVATVRAEKLLGSLREPMTLAGVRVVLAASAGLAVAAGAEVGCDELLRRADVAMYRAKRSERPLRLAIYHHVADRTTSSNLTLRAEVPRAAATGAWELAYRPIVDLATGAVTGADTLTRWQHPDLDRLPTAVCLGILQRSGQLHPFVRALLERALADLSGWTASGFHLSLTVPLTPQAIAAPDIETVVGTALSTHDVDPRRLTIELAHTTGVGHSAPVDTRLANLHTTGVRVALDGTGTSTLTVLHDLPVDELRISHRFVTAATTSAKATAIVSAITELARRFGLPATAEGIEQHRQRQAMWEIGCTHGTGMLFGRPLSAAAMLATLRHGYNGTPGHLSRPLHPTGTVIRLRDYASGGR